MLSDGNDTIENIVSKAQKYGFEIGISDHILCKKLPYVESVLSYLNHLSRFPVLKGGEVDLGEAKYINDAITSKIDYIIGSIHSVKIGDSVIKFGKYFDYRDKRKILNKQFIFYDYMCCTALETILNTLSVEFSRCPIDILGHCTVNPFYEQVNVKFRYEWENEVISLCKAHNVAIEISGLWIEPSIDFIKRAVEKNAKVTFGSDCHTKYARSFLDYYYFAKKVVPIKNGDVLKIVK